MATGTMKMDGIIVERVFIQNSATIGTTYTFDLTGYKAGVVWINQAGWRDSLILPTQIFVGAYAMSTGGANNTIRVDITSTSIKVSKIDASISDTYDVQIFGIR